MKRVEPDPLAEIILSHHAHVRLLERSTMTAEEAEKEIREAILERRIQHNGRNIWEVHARHSGLRYPAAFVPAKLIVLTVLDQAA